MCSEKVLVMIHTQTFLIKKYNIIWKILLTRIRIIWRNRTQKKINWPIFCFLHRGGSILTNATAAAYESVQIVTKVKDEAIVYITIDITCVSWKAEKKTNCRKLYIIILNFPVCGLNLREEAPIDTNTYLIKVLINNVKKIVPLWFVHWDVSNCSKRN